ncbi:MAG: asparagine synthetase B family protein [Alphaproteobacteria bacterium]|nr:asparagine synthetase B family protein [Alphaproteobacteria bacterium]
MIETCFILDGPFRHWQRTIEAGRETILVGHRYAPDHLPVETSEDIPTLIENATSRLGKQTGFHGGFVRNGDTLIAWADHIRSFPIFYSFKDGRLFIGNDARSVRDAADIDVADSESLIEFAMSGYATGKHTLYRDLKVIQPGELIVWREGMDAPFLHRWFRYVTMPDPTHGWEDNRTRLGEILDRQALEIIERADGRPIWIPLSAGLDSRIILCKLHEHGYRNLHTFTYGPRFNFEAKYAQRVARKLNVPWQFTGLSMRACRAIYASPERNGYQDYADGLKAAPSMREFCALKTLKDKRTIPPEAILINGQTGDYLTGGHIPGYAVNSSPVSETDYLHGIASKHYDLWKNLASAENLDTIRRRIYEQAPYDCGETNPAYWGLKAEQWEYDARQVCLVVNGQRSYEFFGWAWELPLWAKDLVDFCARLPLDQKIGQALFKDYLRAYNYCGLFPTREPELWRWPAPMLWVIPAAQIANLFGKRHKANFYALMRYFGHYSNQFAFFPFGIHAKHYRNTRNIFSLYVRQWLMENEMGSPDIRRAMGLPEDNDDVD